MVIKGLIELLVIDILQQFLAIFGCSECFMTVRNLEYSTGIYRVRTMVRI